MNMMIAMMAMMMMTEGSLGFDVGANGPTSRSAPDWAPIDKCTNRGWCWSSTQRVKTRWVWSNSSQNKKVEMHLCRQTNLEIKHSHRNTRKVILRHVFGKKTACSIADCGRHVVTKWLPCGRKVVTKWSPSSHQMVTKWSSRSHQEVTKWSPSGHQVVTKWSPSGHQVVTK